MARANGLAYAFLRSLEGAGTDVPPAVAAAWARERAARDTYERTLDLVQECARAGGFDFAVIKNIWTIPHVPRDVDLFVREAQIPEFLRALEDRGFEILYDDPAEISAAKAGHLRVDLYPRIHYLGRDFLDERMLADARTTEPLDGRVLPTIRADVAFALNSIHSIFGHGALTLLDLLDLRALARRLGGTAPARAHAEALGWARAFDLWTDRLERLGGRLVAPEPPPRFPVRHDRAFVGRIVSALDGEPLRWRTRAALRLSLLWDDLLFASEGSGLQEGLRRSAVASSVANATGHRIRTLRGDRKRLGGGSR